MTIDELQDEVIEEFQDFDDWMDKYQLLIDLGNEQPPLDPQYKTDDNLIDGCQSRVWLQADMRDGLLHLEAESDALIVKGIIALLIRILSDHTPAEILSADLYFIESIGLKEHLSPTRSNGLLAMVRKIRMYALAFSQQQYPPTHHTPPTPNHPPITALQHPSITPPPTSIPPYAVNTAAIQSPPQPQPSPTIPAYELD